MKHLEGYLLNKNKPKEVIIKGNIIANENIFCSTFPNVISITLYKKIDIAIIKL